MIIEISFIVFSILAIIPIQCRESRQPKSCQCCQCCQCCCKNPNNITSNVGKCKFNDNGIYYYLKQDYITQEDINKIAENYLRIINEADDTVKTLNDVATEELTSKIIIEYLGINEAINEINKLSSVREKIIKINWIVNNDFINKIYTYENSNKKLPRCLVEHENNNCVLESYFTAMLGNPYRVKFFYLLNYLFEKGFLLKENYPVTFEVCKFFYEAVNHPNFTDTIRCISVMKAYFDNYSYRKYAQEKDKYGKILHAYGSFQHSELAYEIIYTITHELNTGQGLQLDFGVSSRINNMWSNHLDVRLGHKAGCHLCHVNKDIKTIGNLNYSGYKGKDNFIHFTSITFFAVEYHFYTFRKINNIWISYDSLNVETPTPVSDKFILRLILNSMLRIHNFNGHYSGYITSIEQHCDLFGSQKMR